MSRTSNRSRNGYALLARSDEWYKQLSHAEIQQIVSDNKAWVDRLMSQGKVKGGLVLTRAGATISGNDRRQIVSDGPFAESKEAIGGTLVLDVETLEEAIAIARTLPSLKYNTTLEVRPIGDECPLQACARQREQEERLVMAGA